MDFAHMVQGYENLARQLLANYEERRPRRALVELYRAHDLRQLVGASDEETLLRLRKAAVESEGVTLLETLELDFDQDPLRGQARVLFEQADGDEKQYPDVIRLVASPDPDVHLELSVQAKEGEVGGSSAFGLPDEPGAVRLVRQKSRDGSTVVLALLGVSESVSPRRR